MPQISEESRIFTQTPELAYVTRQMTDSRRIERPIHQHTDLTEMLFVYRGEGAYVCDGYAYPIHPGDFLLYNQGSMHEVQSASEMEIGTYCFGISGLQLAGQEPGFMTAPAAEFVRACGDRFREVDALCRIIYDLISKQEPYERIAAQNLFVGLLLLALRCSADERNTGLDRDAVLAARIRQYITLHYTEPLTLGAIARALHISPYYASHVFKQETGLSPIQFMINCRVGEAQNLLIASDYSATQISTMVGYDSINHFSAIFKKKVGISPIQYRKHYLECMHGKRTQ